MKTDEKVKTEERQVECSKCQGFGYTWMAGGRTIQCGRCKGAGTVPARPRT